MWRKHRSIFHDHVGYIHIYIVNPFKVVIIQYYERVCDIYDLAKYLPPFSMKGQEYDEADCSVRDK